MKKNIILIWYGASSLIRVICYVALFNSLGQNLLHQRVMINIVKGKISEFERTHACVPPLGSLAVPGATALYNQRTCPSLCHLTLSKSQGNSVSHLTYLIFVQQPPISSWVPAQRAECVQCRWFMPWLEKPAVSYNCARNLPFVPVNFSLLALSSSCRAFRVKKQTKKSPKKQKQKSGYLPLCRSVMPAIYHAVKQMISCVFSSPANCFDPIMKIHGEKKLVCIIVMN